MARIRTIKPGFFTSEDVSDLTLRARLTWIGLWTHCDDEGRTKDNVKLIKAAVWPLDSISLKEIEEDLIELADHGRIVRYEVDGKPYLAVTNWRDHQKINKPSPSKFPPPPTMDGDGPHRARSDGPGDNSLHETADRTESDSRNTPGTLPEDSGRPPAGKGKEGNREGKGKGKGTTPPTSSDPPTGGRADQGTRLPDDFAVTPDMAAWACEKAPTCGLADHEAFCDYWWSAPGTKGRKLDWVATWRNWMRKEHERRAGPAHRNGGQPPEARRSTADERVAQAQALKAELRGAPPLNLIQGELA